MAGHVIYVHATIPAPPEAVWDVITDIARAHEILRSVRRREPLTGPGYDVGTHWREERTLFGHHGEGERRVVECEPPRRTVVETHVGHDLIRTSYRIAPFGFEGDRSRLAMTTRLDTSGRSVLGNVAWELFGGLTQGHTRRILEHDLEDVAAEALRRARVGQPSSAA